MDEYTVLATLVCLLVLILGSILFLYIRDKWIEKHQGKEKREPGEVREINYHPGDKLIFSHPGRISKEEKERVISQFKNDFQNIRGIVIEEGVTLTILHVTGQSNGDGGNSEQKAPEPLPMPEIEIRDREYNSSRQGTNCSTESENTISG
jgi:hypothetical protein